MLSIFLLAIRPELPIDQSRCSSSSFSSFPSFPLAASTKHDNYSLIELRCTHRPICQSCLPGLAWPGLPADRQKVLLHLLLWLMLMLMQQQLNLPWRRIATLLRHSLEVRGKLNTFAAFFALLVMVMVMVIISKREYNRRGRIGGEEKEEVENKKL